MTDAVVVSKGLDGIVVDNTKLSLVDGEKGELVYYGYHIDEIALCSYEEICHLFLHGELPTRSQLTAMDDSLRKNRAVPEPVLDYIYNAPKNENAMATLRTATSMLSGYMPEAEEMKPPALHTNAVALTAKIATIAAAIARAKKGQKAIAPDASLSHAANFLFMCRGEKPIHEEARALDTALVLHADHGFNASTFVARCTVSSLSDMVSGVTAAIASLKGPLHGGANTAVMDQLMEIGTVENVEPWVEKILAEKKKVMGFGHRVYRVLDPRAKHLKKMSKEWGERAHNTKWFEMSDKLEEVMKRKKNLNANVDFYSASTYYSMGIMPELYTCIFAIARMIGWTAHIIEQLADNRIVRPEAAYMGPLGKKFKPIEAR